MIKKICPVCKIEFNAKTKKQKCCSRKCGAKLPWLNDEYVIKMSEINKKSHNTKSARLNNSIAQKEAQNRPEVKEKAKLKSTEYSNRPDVKEKFQKLSKEYHNRPEVKKATSEWTKAFLKKEGSKSKWQAGRDFYYKEVYPNDVKAQLNASERQKEINSRKEIKLMKSNAMKKNWSDPEFAIKMINNRRKYKEFVLPSGKIVKLQGYEDHVLKTLLQKYNESDILINLRDIIKKIGRIKYQYKLSTHTYYPDFYIISENKIIEVKSKYTFNVSKEKNLAKEQSCLQQGFKFEFVIL